MASYNDEAFKNYNEKALDACPNCGRTFLPDRLVVHLKSCKAHGMADSSSPQKGSPQKSSPMGGNVPSMGGKGSPLKTIIKPKTVVCYICGREFGTTSIEIHLKSCIQKWEIDESKKPPKERRPVPEPPKHFDDVSISLIVI